MNKLLISLVATVFLLAGCGAVDYDDPKEYTGLIKDEIKGDQKEFAKAIDEFGTTFEATEQLDGIFESYYSIIELTVEYYGGDKETLYNDLEAYLETLDLSEDAAEINSFLEKYNALGDTLKDGAKPVVKGVISIFDSGLATVVDVAETDEFKTVIESAQSFDEVKDNFDGLIDEYKDSVDLDSLLD